MILCGMYTHRHKIPPSEWYSILSSLIVVIVADVIECFTEDEGTGPWKVTRMTG